MLLLEPGSETQNDLKGENKVDDNNQLVPQPRGTSAIEKASLSPQSLSILNELYVCGANSKAETDERLNQEFLREFAKENPAVITWAFREHRRNSHFFPAIDEIRILVDRRRRQLHEDAEDRRRREEQADTKRRLAAGEELVTLDEVKRILKEAADKSAMGDGPRMPRSDELRVKPPLELSRHEWELRRNTEKARLNEYLAAKG